VRRNEVVLCYLDLFLEPNYLEVGVHRGETFHAVKARHKVAVDPQFQIENADREALSEYRELTSDAYFSSLDRDAPLFNVIYLDGLHTFEQTLRDLLNSIDYLLRDGVIIIDDVLPSSYHSSLPILSEAFAVRNAVKGEDTSWMGDVFRLVFFIQSFLPRFDYATVSENHGQLVMWRGQRNEKLFADRRVEDIARLEFRHLVTQLADLNLLKNREILVRVKKALSQPTRTI
jgi:hypothetical protein